MKRQIKNQALHTIWLFLLTNIFENVSNWSRHQRYLTIYPPFLFNIYRAAILEIFLGKFFSSFCRFFLLYLSFLVQFQLGIYLQKATLHQGNYFFRCNFSIKLSWLQRRYNKFGTILTIGKLFTKLLFSYFLIEFW